LSSENLLTFLLFSLSDPAMKQFLLHLDEKSILGRRFILQDLDDTHLFIAADIIEILQTEIDGLMDKISFPLHEKEN
jgi:TFIIH basal transcription factor complex TTD-A subunit